MRTHSNLHFRCVKMEMQTSETICPQPYRTSCQAELLIKHWDKHTHEGCPGQWFPIWGLQPMTSDLHGNVPHAQVTPQNAEALGQSWTDLEALHPEVSRKRHCPLPCFPSEQRGMQIFALKLTGTNKKGVFGRAVMQNRV